MKLFLDTADLEEIRAANETGLISGVTTNPSLLAGSSDKSLVDCIEEIHFEFPHFESISAEVVGDNDEHMYELAESFFEWSNVTIKLPCTVDGLKACSKIASTGRKVNVTLVFSVAQAILAEKSGAAYISPFVGRLEDQSVDGLGLIKDLKELYSGHGRFTTTQILSASIRDVRQVEQCALLGSDIATVPPKVFWKMYDHILTQKGNETFAQDWEKVRFR